MLKALNSGTSALTAQQASLDLIAENIANVNTTGYKEATGQFADLVYRQMSGDTTGNPGPLVGQGTRMCGSQLDFSQGSLVQTGRTLDLAIAGSGFLQVLTPEGETAYTRNGNLGIDADGRLITEGGVLIPQISVPADSEVNIMEDGRVMAKDPKTGSTQQIGVLELTHFVNPRGLEKMGDSLYRATTNSGNPQTGIPGSQNLGTFRTGCLENSNVDLANAMNAMLQAQRAYQLNGKVVSNADEMLGMANSLRR